MVRERELSRWLRTREARSYLTSPLFQLTLRPWDEPVRSSEPPAFVRCSIREDWSSRAHVGSVKIKSETVTGPVFFVVLESMTCETKIDILLYRAVNLLICNLIVIYTWTQR